MKLIRTLLEEITQDIATTPAKWNNSEWRWVFSKLQDALTTLEAASAEESEAKGVIQEIRKRSSVHTEKDGSTHYHVNDSLLNELETKPTMGADSMLARVRAKVKEYEKDADTDTGDEYLDGKNAAYREVLELIGLIDVLTKDKELKRE